MTFTYLDVLPLLFAACPSCASSTHAAEADENDGEYIGVGEAHSLIVEGFFDDLL